MKEKHKTAPNNILGMWIRQIAAAQKIYVKTAMNKNQTK